MQTNTIGQKVLVIAIDQINVNLANLKETRFDTCVVIDLINVGYAGIQKTHNSTACAYNLFSHNRTCTGSENYALTFKDSSDSVFFNPINENESTPTLIRLDTFATLYMTQVEPVDHPALINFLKQVTVTHPNYDILINTHPTHSILIPIVELHDKCV